MKTKHIFAILLIISLHLTISFLQAGTTGKIAGKVVDAETGEGLIGVNILVEGTTLGAATDLDGYYVILNVPPGKYNITAMMIGYQDQKIINVNVSIDFTSKVNFELRTGALELGEEITVIAERPMVRKDLTSTSATVSTEEISELPVEDFAQVLQLQAGIITGADGSLHIRGGRASEIGYMVNGVSVTDPYSGNIAIEVENDGIQELQVISGTFNAEYGQAMSGVVEVVTKEGGDKLKGSLSLYSGDYISNNTATFLNIDDFDPLSISNIQASLSGPIPILGKKFSFFATARFYNNTGWLYGQRVFNPKDSSNFDSPNPEDWYIESSGDSEMVSMNPFNKITAQGNLTYKLSPTLKLGYGFLWDKVKYRKYNQSFKYNPDGDYRRFKNGYTHLLNLNHTLSSKMFYTAKFSYFFFDFKKYVYENPLDSRYADPRLLKGKFRTGGTEMNHFYRNTKSLVAKFDLTNQLTKTHQFKTGFEIRKSKLWLHEFDIKYDRSTGWKPQVPPDTTGVLTNNEYTHRPVEFSVYLQDKMEFENIIVNAGIRYDYFNPDGDIPVKKYYYTTQDGQQILREGDRDPLNAPKVKAKSKHQISPRIGIAYPITERGIIHFSYGHFFQMPTYEYLYHNSEFEVEFGGLKTLMGNADLKPQKTVIYELGLQQQLSNNIGLDITGFYKDIRNLLGTKIIEHYTATMLYAKYVNRDYGNVRGFTLALEKRSTNFLSARIDYTFQVAEGNASDPNSVFLDNQSSPPRESEIKVVPLDWDQTHTLNVSIILSQTNNWGLSLLARLGSGLPYTPSFQGIRTSYENSERKPSNFTVDLNAHKDFYLSGIKSTIFLRIYNLFDRKNEITVFDDTGRAGYTLASFYAGDWRNYSTQEDYYNRPNYYSEPRRVILGMSLGF
ncbi:MAG TPA: TonB-dependent receptor [Caldithrix sp.]|nr:TonB-dependent receptor [Caldithrix sp.]